MDNVETIDKLNLHLQSFEEGFDILVSSKSKQELESNFARILKGNLLVKKAELHYFKNNTWTLVFPEKDSTEIIDFPLPDKIKLYKDFPNDNSYTAVISIESGEAYSIVISNKLNKTEFNSEDILNLKLFAQLLFEGYHAFRKIKHEKELIFSLNNKILQLNTLIDTGIELSKLDNVTKLISLSIERAVSITNSSRGVVKISREGIYQKSYCFPSDFEFNEDQYSKEFIIKSEIIHQQIKLEYYLLEKECRKGICGFEDTDQLLLDAIARQVKTALENDYLVKQLIDKHKIEKELELAAEIQRIIIPDKLPEITGYKLAGINIPSKEVGGDYYDVISLKDGRIALIIADVTGKGVPAALLVSTLNASLNAYIDLGIPMTELASKINSQIFTSSTSDKFITFFMAVLTPETGELEIVNAGHNPSLLLTNENEIKLIEAGGLAFGMFDMGMPFNTEIITINSKERLLMFTDGIPEAMNENNEEFSDEKLEDIFKNYKPDDPSLFIERIINETKEHAGSTPQSDDITALYLLRE